MRLPPASDGTLVQLRKALGRWPRIYTRARSVYLACRSALAADGCETATDLLGTVPLSVVRPNRPFMQPSAPQRAGIVVRYQGNRLSPEQPGTLWLDDTASARAATFLRRREPLAAGDELTIVDNRYHDLAVGVPMVKVRRKSSAAHGFVTLTTLIGECAACDESLWIAGDTRALRNAIVFESAYGTLFSTNRMHATDVLDTRRYLRAFGDPAGPRRDGSAVHPLEAAAHVHRIGAWALGNDRPSRSRARIATLIERMFEHYGLPAARTEGPGTAWPYTFDFKMPWGTVLKSPWYSGYANSAMTGAAACAHALTGRPAYRELALSAAAFLRMPAADGGPLYRVDGHTYIAEYCYHSPPLPNYRVLDGELCSVVYIYNAALLLADAALLDFAIELGEGLRAALPLFCPGDGAPVFGMDGQPMNPNYMWQNWATLHILANMFKDRSFLAFAPVWREAIPQELRDTGYPI